MLERFVTFAGQAADWTQVKISPHQILAIEFVSFYGHQWLSTPRNSKRKAAASRCWKASGGRIPSNTAAAHFAISDTGSLFYVPDSGLTGAPQQWKIALVERSGKPKLLPLPPQSYYRPRFSPDGKQLAFGKQDGRESNILI
jgi:hypothetical protein